MLSLRVLIFRMIMMLPLVLRLGSFSCYSSTLKVQFFGPTHAILQVILFGSNRCDPQGYTFWTIWDSQGHTFRIIRVILFGPYRWDSQGHTFRIIHMLSFRSIQMLIPQVQRLGSFRCFPRIQKVLILQVILLGSYRCYALGPTFWTLQMISSKSFF